MRGFSYEMTLDGKGYQLSNGTGLSSLMQPDSIESIRNPGIQMEVESCSSLAKACNKFSALMSADRADDSFFEHKDDILLGKNTDWKLVQVCIKNYRLELNYINLQLYKKFEEDMKNGKIDQQVQKEYDCDSPVYFPPYYARLMFCDFRFVKTELTFKTVDVYGITRDHIHVFMSSDGTVELIELDKDKQRRFVFRNDEASRTDTTMVEITECIN